MPRFKIYGAHADSCEAIQCTVHAETPDEAEAIASHRRIIVSRIVEVEKAGSQLTHTSPQQMPATQALPVEASRPARASRADNAGVATQQQNQVVNVHVTTPQAQTKRWSRGVAIVLSFLIPGLGQLYKGQIFNGIAWFVVVIVGYFFLIIPGIILHLFCIIGAASGDPYKGR